jgi:hypothetical protein
MGPTRVAKQETLQDRRVGGTGREEVVEEKTK